MALKFREAFYVFCLVMLTAWLSKYFVQFGLVPFYDLLDVPAVTPDKNYFTYVWNGLYVLLFFSFYLALTRLQTLEQLYDVNTLFVMSFFIQILWTFSFFYLQMPWVAGIVIVLLDLIALMLVHTLWDVSKASAWFFLPYLLWLFFATYLNMFIVIMN